MARDTTPTDCTDPEPIDVDAEARLDWSDDPERPLAINIELPADVVDDPDDVLGAVQIDATLAGD